MVNYLYQLMNNFFNYEIIFIIYEIILKITNTDVIIWSLFQFRKEIFMKKLFKLSMVLLVALSLVACKQNEETTTNVTTTESSNIIGFVGPLEGEYSVYGNSVLNGAKLYLEEYNKANGTNYVLKTYDSKGDNSQAVSAYHKLVEEDKAVAIFGGVTSGESIAIASASQSYNTPVISASATAVDFTKAGKNIFRGAFTDPFQAKVLAEFTFDTLKAKKVAIIYDTGSDYAKGVTEVFSKVYTEKGGNIALSEGYNSGDVDFTSQLTKIKAENVDVLLVPNYYKDVALILSQAKNLNLDVQIIGGDGWDGVLSVASDVSILENAIFVNHYAPDNQKVVDWLEKYKTTYGIDGNSFSILAYDTMGILLEALAKSPNKNNEEIINNLAQTSYDGILGHVEFDENGDPVKDLGFIVIKNGVYTTYSK